VLLLAVGVVLSRWLGSIQRERSLGDAVKSAQIVAQAAVQPLLEPSDLQQDFRALDLETRQDLDDSFGSAISTDGVVRLKIWNAQHWIVYSDNPLLVNRWFPGDEALSRALDGEVNSLVTDLSRPEELEERDFGQLLAVYVPLRVDAQGLFTNDPAGRVIGAFEIYVPYAPIAAGIAEDSRTLTLALGVGLLVLYLGLFRLVSGASRRLRTQAAQNAHQATHDSLTDLPNRHQLLEDLQDMLDRRSGSKYVALALVDIDRFKEINDALGHPSGDTVLRAIADRFREHMPDATVARIGGDEFGIAAANLPHAQAALAVATRIENMLEAPFEVAGISVSVRPSIGIALGPDDGRNADELLQHADVAMYVAKQTGCVRKMYSRTLDHYSPDRLQLAGELRDAIANASGEVHLAYQPKLDLATDEVRSVECLVRWKHPQRGFIPPAEFLPIIENTELIAPLTWLVLDQALTTCAGWRRHGLEIQMAVNISPRTIGSAELCDRVRASLTAHDLPPSALELELTENALLGDHSLAADNVAKLRELGVGVAIDDFGTGYASIGYLTTLPITSVKIDRSFVSDMFSDPAAAAVVNFSLGLGQQLGLEVVAEGIEDEPTLEELRRLGCTTGQGYFISRPLGATEFLHWLLAWSTRHLTPADIAPELQSSGGTSVPAYGGSPYDLVSVGASSAGAGSTPATAAAPATSPLAPLPMPTPFALSPTLDEPSWTDEQVWTAQPSEHIGREPLIESTSDTSGTSGTSGTLGTFGIAEEADQRDVFDSLDAGTLAGADDDVLTPADDVVGSVTDDVVDDDDDVDPPMMPLLPGLGASLPPRAAIPGADDDMRLTTNFDDLAPLYERNPSPPRSEPAGEAPATIEMTSTAGLPAPLLADPVPADPAPLAPSAAPSASGGPLLPSLPPLSLRLRHSTSGSTTPPDPTAAPSADDSSEASS
jgi:diguanylate cyclase (GGDEF)-like protein